MFGMLRPHAASMSEAARAVHRRFYCGTCAGIGRHHGQALRATLSYDAVFVGLMADALMEEAADPEACRCPMLPVVHRDALDPDAPAMRYAAAVQVLLGDQWLADRAEDGGAVARLARPALSGAVAQARASLDALGIDWRPWRDLERAQAAAEVVGETGPEEAAEPTARALALVFAQLARLDGATDAARVDAARERLARLGRALGQIIYTIDALEDLPDDAAEGAFNPCMVRRDGDVRVDPDRVQWTSAMLDTALGRAADALDALPLARHREALQSVVLGTLPERAEAAKATARAYVASLAAGARTPSAPARWAGLVWAWMLGVWAWTRARLGRPLPTPLNVTCASDPAPMALALGHMGGGGWGAVSAAGLGGVMAAPGALAHDDEDDDSDEDDAKGERGGASSHSGGLSGCSGGSCCSRNDSLWCCCEMSDCCCYYDDAWHCLPANGGCGVDCCPCDGDGCGCDVGDGCCCPCD